MYIESKMREWEGTRDEDKVSREKKIKEKSWEDIYIYIIILIIERMEKWNEKIVKYSRKENVRVRERARARVREREGGRRR